MNTAIWLPLSVLALGLVYLMASRMGRRKPIKQHGGASFSGVSRLPLRVYKYRAVELQLCDSPCESALAIAGKRLLKSEAPALPFVGCRYKTCLCTYTQYDDRRLMQREERRLQQRRSESSPYGRTSDRRLSEERRKAVRDRRGRTPG